MPFQPVTVGYLALGNLVSLFAEKLVGNGGFTLLMQHSKADLPLYVDRDCPNRNVDQSHADAAGPGWMAGEEGEGLFFNAHTGV